jgi:NTE family protein
MLTRIGERDRGRDRCLMPVAFVLSGGASLGASQAGMLEALYERGIRPDIVVGTSVGAINGAFIASRPPTVETARDLQQIWRGLTRAHVFPANPVTAGLGLLGLRDHTVSASSLRRLVRRHLEIERLEDAAVELHVVAADVLTGEEVLLSTGHAVDAVLASAAIPGVFPAVPWDSRLLMDGAIVNNAPVSHAIELGANRVIVLNAIARKPLSRVPRGILATGAAAVSHALARRFAEDVERYAGAAELVILPAPVLEGILPSDFGHARELIAQGLARTRCVLPRGGEVVQLPLAA